MGFHSDSALSPLSSVLGLSGTFRKGLLFMINFAWASRLRLPLLIMVGFMAFDIRMQLEINIDVEMRHMHYHDEHDYDSLSTDSDFTEESSSEADSEEAEGDEGTEYEPIS